MVGGEYSTDDYEFFKVTVRAVITKKMCKHAVKKLPFVIRYVPDDIRLSKYVNV